MRHVERFPMMLQEGQNLGPYRIIAQLGQGGMATVFKAYHARLDRFVAIKMMHQAFLEDTAFLARFEREAQIVARLEHSHIVPVYDFSDFNGQPYLVMKFVEGHTLKALLSKGPLPLSEILRIMTAVGDALDYAHTQGVLHRDIKPSNIMVDVNNVPHLTDFGLARIAQAGESTLSQDMLLGTPHYISPEQAMGRKDLDSQTDLYSLGVILYELIVGRVPFSADTPYAIIHDHIYRPLPLPSSVNPEIPSAVENVLLKALAKEPSDRYETAARLVGTLREAAQDTNLIDLKSDRASTSAVSIAKLRDQQDASGTFTPNLSTSLIPSPLPSASVTMQQAARSPSGSRWVLAGLIALVFICIASVGVALSAVDIFTEMAVLDSQQIQAAVIQLYDIPMATADEARAALAQDTDDPVRHLTLARALWNEEDAQAARTALMDGYNVADDKETYLLSAADAARQDGFIPIAVLLYDRALAESAGDPLRLANVRALVGETFYDLASQPNALNPIEIRRLMSADSSDPSSLLETMLARVLITETRFALAQAALGRVLAQNSTLPEAHLVLGDLYFATDETERANEEWGLVMSAEDAPDWAREQAADSMGFAF
jgi:serine/threonine protein kinase